MGYVAVNAVRMVDQKILISLISIILQYLFDICVSED